MAVVIVPEYSLSIDGTKIYVTDKTGAYHATTNVTGWGDPNAELAQSALVCLVVRKASTGDELFEPILPVNAFVYDNSAANTKETGFEIVFAADGVFDIALLRLAVSFDGATDAEDNDLAANQYFYQSGVIYQMVDGTPVEVEDLLDLLEDDTIIKTVCSDILTPKLAIERQVIHKEYYKCRLKDPDESEDTFQKGLKLAEDIRGAYYAFYSNLKVEAQNQIEKLIDEHKILA